MIPEKQREEEALVLDFLKTAMLMITDQVI